LVVVGTVLGVVVGTPAGVVAVVVVGAAVVVVAVVAGSDRPLVSGGRWTDASSALEPPQPAAIAASARRSRPAEARRRMPAL